MKAITLWQPWASLIALGHKQFETRSWPVRYRGKLIIHSAQRKLTRNELELLEYIKQEYHIEVNPDELPLGSVVAVANLVSCYPTQFLTDDSILDESSVTALEHDLGNWQPNRYAWELDDIIKLNTPLNATGQQGLWEPDPGLIHQIRKELQ